MKEKNRERRENSSYPEIRVKQVWVNEFQLYVPLLRMWHRRCFHGINVMILMPQIFDVIAIENARYKRNELELYFHVQSNLFSGTTLGKLQKWSHKTGGL